MEQLLQNNSLLYPVECYSPIDVLYRINPELGSLAYARRAELLTPDLMPLFAKFREFQSAEKIEVMKSIIQRLGIEAHEREIIAGINGEITRTRISEDSETDRIRFTQDGLTERENIIARRENYSSDNQLRGIEIQGKSIVDREKVIAEKERYFSDIQLKGIEMQSKAELEVQKMKCLTDAKIYEDRMKGQMYISNNEAEARKIEALARKDSIVLAEQIRSGTLEKISANQLEAKVRTALIQTNARIREAEEMRRREVELAYINQETMMHAHLMQVEAERARANGLIGVEAYKFMGYGIIEGTRALVEMGKSHYTASGENSLGKFNLNIVIE
jgi:hypothetical protein